MAEVMNGCAGSREGKSEVGINLLETSLFKELRRIYENACGDAKYYDIGKLRKIEVGMRLKYVKKICELDVLMFGVMSGDFNPIHFDRSVAAKTKFGEPVAHGLLTASLISAMLSKLPGIPVLLNCSLSFKAPVKIGDVVEVEGEVAERDQMKRNRFTIRVTCKVEGKVVVEGNTKVLIWDINT